MLTPPPPPLPISFGSPEDASPWVPRVESILGSSRVVLVTELDKVKGALTDLKKSALVDASIKPHRYMVGFDTEFISPSNPQYEELARFYLQKQEGNELVCVISFATAELQVVIHIAQIMKDHPELDGHLPKCLKEVLVQGSWMKYGVGADNDASFCHRCFGMNEQLQGIHDLEGVAALSGLASPSLEYQHSLLTTAGAGAGKAPLGAHDWSTTLTEEEVTYAGHDAQMGFNIAQVTMRWQQQMWSRLTRDRPPPPPKPRRKRSRRRRKKDPMGSPKPVQHSSSSRSSSPARSSSSSRSSSPTRCSGLSASSSGSSSDSWTGTAGGSLRTAYPHGSTHPTYSNVSSPRMPSSWVAVASG